MRASGFTFSGRLCGQEGGGGDVLLLHGFPESFDMFGPLQRRLAVRGLRSFSYNQRGYSPGAAPDMPSSYHYDVLRDDVFAVADAVGFGRFHLVGHDHGALLAWRVAGSPRGRDRLVSLTALAVPHPDAFSAGLFGEGADADQQMAAQYFSVFTREASPAPLRAGLLFWTMGLAMGFLSEAAFKKALWWYTGAFDAGVLARPPSMTAAALWSAGAKGSACLRAIYGGIPDEGLPQASPTGNIDVPVLYACGSSDRFILGNKPFAMKSADFCSNGYRFLEFECGHVLLARRETAVSAMVVDEIVFHITGTRD